LKTFAFIFVRSGSKGLPGKNTKLLLGKPLLAYSIECAHSIRDINRVFVSTDSADIADIALEYGAEVPFIRPADLAGDDSSEWDAWRHAVSFVSDNIESFDCFVSLPATAPCREYHDVKSCIEMLCPDTDIVITGSKSGHHPAFNMVKLDNNISDCSRFLDGDTVYRRQQVQQPFNMSTVAYVTRPDYILNTNSIWDGVVKLKQISKLSAIDIDDIEDFRMAELILKDRAR